MRKDVGDERCRQKERAIRFSNWGRRWEATLAFFFFGGGSRMRGTETGEQQGLGLVSGQWPEAVAVGYRKVGQRACLAALAVKE